MRVVSNTSPILNLAIIDQLALLHDQFGEVWIPAAVLSELRERAGFYIATDLYIDLLRESEETEEH